MFESLVMAPDLKMLVRNLIHAHAFGSSGFDDVVRGKGKGLTGLLFGAPGLGKTLTAEAIAEVSRLPLYTVSSGSLGHESDVIEDNLTRILQLTTRWNAVLLIDEADVFLAKRDKSDLKRNAIVSVFLRELEYYPGILILTTNQASIIDPAFKSKFGRCFSSSTE
jgi:SpoVK/Ycf46/Vps4 family AAA+-type ATPase